MPNQDQTASLITTLQTAHEGLRWSSEIDAPFSVLHWTIEPFTALSTQQILELTHHSPTAPIEAIEFDDFFATATADQDWFGTEERATSAQYRALVATLKQHLSHLTVYRVGDVRIDIYILGQTESGDWLGLATQAVET